MYLYAVHYFLVLMFLITGNYILTTFIQFPLPLHPPSGKHKFNLFYLFVYLLNLSTMLYNFLGNIVIWYFYTLQNDHHDKSSYHLSPYKNTLLLAVLPKLSFLSLWLIYFIIGNMYLLISLTFLTHLHTPLPSGKHLFVLCMYDSVSS